MQGIVCGSYGEDETWTAPRVTKVGPRAPPGVALVPLKAASPLMARCVETLECQFVS